PGLHSGHRRTGPGLGVSARLVDFTMSESVVLLGIVISASSGIPSLLAARTSMVGQWGTTVAAVVGAGLGLGGIGWFWATGDSQPIVRPWPLTLTEFNVALDGFSAFFLPPFFMIA